MTASIPHMETGTELGGYRIDGVAGQGGMGVVYRATQLGLDRPVALKVIAVELANNLDFRNRFKSEAQLAASIDHPNVVPVFEAGEADGVLYLAMRYVEGTDLRSLVDREGGLAPERAVRIIWQVAAALDAAHRRGLVHRDVKPPNVLIADEGDEHAYLTDFGLTKHAAAAGGITRTGQFVGTPDFVAPEQIRGEAADARADIYALGGVLFHALTGRTPFPRDSELAKMYAHLSDPAPAASPLVPGVPAALDAVIGTAMAKEADDRYASAGDLARAAWAALEGESAPPQAGSVATGAAAPGQEPPAPDTPAPRTHLPHSSVPTPAPSLARSMATAPPSGATAEPPPPEKPKSAGPAGWPRRRRMALLIALPCLLLVAGTVAVLAAAGLLSGSGEGTGDERVVTGQQTADTSADDQPTETGNPRGRRDDRRPRRPRRRRRRRRQGLRLLRRGGHAQPDRRQDQRARRRAGRRRHEPRRDRRRQGRGLGGRRQGLEPPAPEDQPQARQGGQRAGRQGRPGRLDRPAARLGLQLGRRHGAAGRPRRGDARRRADRRRRPADRHLRRLQGVGGQLRRRHAHQASTSRPRRSRASRSRSATGRAA